MNFFFKPKYPTEINTDILRRKIMTFQKHCNENPGEFISTYDLVFLVHLTVLVRKKLLKII